jgi:hypothetical protein
MNTTMHETFFNIFFKYKNTQKRHTVTRCRERESRRHQKHDVVYSEDAWLWLSRARDNNCLQLLQNGAKFISPWNCCCCFLLINDLPNADSSRSFACWYTQTYWLLLVLQLLNSHDKVIIIIITSHYYDHHWSYENLISRANECKFDVLIVMWKF